jgi:RimJ/RimL family protein N-acetyltransferase
MIAQDDGRLLGEVGLFPRNATGRVAFADADADRVELGYWLRADAIRQGFVIEAASALLDAAFAIKEFSHAEIRCDPRNAPSVAVAQRLGFTLVETTDEPLQVWMRPS